VTGPRCWPVVLIAVACAPDPPPTQGPPASNDGIPTPDLEDVDPDVVRAIEKQRAALAEDLDSASAWSKLGTRYYVHEFEDEAAQCLAQAEELEPDVGMWPYRRGWMLFDRYPDEALAAFERALTWLGDYAPAQEAVGRTLVRLGRSEEAFAHFARATELDSESAFAEAGLGQIELERGEFEQARAHLEEALKRDPRHTEAHIAIAQVYLALGRNEDARRHAARSRQLPPTSVRQDRLASMNALPAGVRARTRFGLQLEKQGRPDEAAAQYRVVLASDPHYYFVRKRLADILLGKGQRAEALELLRAGLELNPGSVEIQRDIQTLEKR
jgi:tetratricopeptide (TPR) repeat protein